MPHVILPAEHTDADLILASQIAQAVDSAALFVAWTPHAGTAIPAVEAELREPRHPLAEAAALFAQGLVELWRAITLRRPATARR
jgi:hypothetical protein